MVGYEYICVSWRVSLCDACKGVNNSGEEGAPEGRRPAGFKKKRDDARSLESDISRAIFHARDTS